MLTDSATSGSHSSKRSRGRKGRQSIKVKAITACSVNVGSLLFESSGGGGGIGKLDAVLTRVYTSSRSVVANRGCRSDMIDGGVVIRIKV